METVIVQTEMDTGLQKRENFTSEGYLIFLLKKVALLASLCRVSLLFCKY